MLNKTAEELADIMVEHLFALSPEEQGQNSCWTKGAAWTI